MDWFVDAIMKSTEVFLHKRNAHDIFICKGVQIRYLNGQLALGGEVLTFNGHAPVGDEVSVELMDKDGSSIRITGLSIEIITGHEDLIYFNATSVPGITQVLYTKTGEVTKQVGFSF